MYVQTKYDLFFYDNKADYKGIQILLYNNPHEAHDLLVKHNPSSGDMHKLLKSVYSHMCQVFSVSGYNHMKQFTDRFELSEEFDPIYGREALIYPVAVDSLRDVSTLFANFNKNNMEKARREESRRQTTMQEQASSRGNPALTAEALKILPDIIRMEPFVSHRGLIAFRRIHIDRSSSIGKENVSFIKLYSSYNAKKAVCVFHTIESENIIPRVWKKGDLFVAAEETYYIPDDVDLYARALAFLMPELHPFFGVDTAVDPYSIHGIELNDGNDLADYPRGVGIDTQHILAMNDEAFDVFLAVRDEWEDSGIRQIVNTSRECYERVMQVYEETRAVCDERSSNRKKDATLHKEREIKLSGIRGEQEVDYVLNWLGGNSLFVDDNTHDKFGNPCVKLKNSKFRDEAQEYDHIVIRENGVFIIETKNYGGKIVISPDGNWTHTNSKGETKGLRNPSQQVYRHEVLLKSFLPRDIPIISVICLSNPNLILEGQSSSKVPVFKSDLLAEYIVEYKSKVKIPLKKMREIKELIESYRSE